MKSKKITKSDIVDALCEKTEIERKKVRAIVELCLDEIKGALLRREDIELRGFGTFRVKTRKAREKARNPRTGEQISTLAHDAVVFRPGATLKQAVREAGEQAAPCEQAERSKKPPVKQSS